MGVVLFANLKGGVAKTTTAVAIAETLACARKRVLVIDADHQSAASELLLGENRLMACERRRATLHDLLGAMLGFEFEAENLDEFVALGASSIGGGLSNLGVIPCSLRIDDFFTNMAKGRKTASFSKDLNDRVVRGRKIMRGWLNRNFDYVIIDCPPSVAFQVRVLLGVADAFVVPSVPDRLSVQASHHFMERIRRIGSKVVGLGTLWTLYRANNEVHERVVAASYRRHPELAALPIPFRTVIPNATAIARACEPTESVASLSVKYEPAFARLYQNLAAEIVARLKEIDPGDGRPVRPRELEPVAG